MEIFSEIPERVRHKILLYLKNPEADIVYNEYITKPMRILKEHLLVSLNRYNYFRKFRKPLWDRLIDPNGQIIVFDFKDTGYCQEKYLKWLKWGNWLSCSERFGGMGLRTALFNKLEEDYNNYNGGFCNPAEIAGTIFDPRAAVRRIEISYEIACPYDKGMPNYSFDTWKKSCYVNGTLPIYQRRKVKAPRYNGRWDGEMGTCKAKIHQLLNKIPLIDRRWRTWRNRKYIKWLYYEKKIS